MSDKELRDREKKNHELFMTLLSLKENIALLSVKYLKGEPLRHGYTGKEVSLKSKWREITDSIPKRLTISIYHFIQDLIVPIFGREDPNMMYIPDFHGYQGAREQAMAYLAGLRTLVKGELSSRDRRLKGRLINKLNNQIIDSKNEMRAMSELWRRRNREGVQRLRRRNRARVRAKKKFKRAQKHLKSVSAFTKHLDDIRQGISVKKECPLCFERGTPDNPLIKGCPEQETCHHRFHRQCIKQWVCQNNNCPMCREAPCASPDIGSPDGLQLGTEVDGNWRGLGYWYRAKVCDYNPETHLYTIRYLTEGEGGQNRPVHVSSYLVDPETRTIPLPGQDDIPTIDGKIEENARLGTEFERVGALGQDLVVNRTLSDDDPDL